VTTETQHTLAWRVSPNPNDYNALAEHFTGTDVQAFLIEGEGGDGAFDIGEVYHWPDFKNESVANARLIAAAPTLLAALQDVSRAYQEMFDVMPVAWQTYDDIVQDAIKAVIG
jgi:hypothetical protein